MRAKAIIRFLSTNDLLPKITLTDDKVLRRIEIERKALITYQQQAYKEGKIQPMINIIEKIQDAVKKDTLTPCEKIESAISIKPNDSYDHTMKEFSLKFGNFALDLYGTEQDLRVESIARRGEIVPSQVKDEETMVLYRKYFVANYNLPGSIENINPNKFLKLKPIEEFPLMPLIPISPMTMKRWEEELRIKKKEGYRFKIDKGRLYSSVLVIATFCTLIVLIYLLYQNDEESWVQIEKTRRKRQFKDVGFY